MLCTFFFPSSVFVLFFFSSDCRHMLSCISSLRRGIATMSPYVIISFTLQYLVQVPLNLRFSKRIIYNLFFHFSVMESGSVGFLSLFFLFIFYLEFKTLHFEDWLIFSVSFFLNPAIDNFIYMFLFLLMRCANSRHRGASVVTRHSWSEIIR